MQKIIYIIRHGESQAQSAETDDYVNPDLSQRGIEQAKRLEPLLRRCHPDLILLSTMQRAWKTWQHAGISAPCVRFDSRLIETFQPEHYLPQLPITLPEGIAEADQQNAYGWPACRRLDHLWQELQQGPHQRIMFFCHWNAAGHFLRAFMGLGARNYVSHARMDNAALSVLELEKQPCLRVWNYTEHLHGLMDSDEALKFLR